MGNYKIEFSVRQVAQPDLLERIKQALATSKLNPHCLKLEITESVVMENAELNLDPHGEEEVSVAYSI